MSAKKATPSSSPSHPPDFRASRIEKDGQEFLVMSYALPDWELPCILAESEREIIHALLAGATHREIAKARGTSARTVANQLASAFTKLGVRSRMELAVLLKRPSTKASPRPALDLPDAAVQLVDESRDARR